MVTSAVVWSSLSNDQRRVARLIGFEEESFGADQLQLVQDLLSGAKDLGIRRLDKLAEVAEILDVLTQQTSQDDVLGLKPSNRERNVAELAGFNFDQLSDQQLMLTRDYLSVADQSGLEGIQNSEQLDQVRKSISDSDASTERPPNLVVFIRD